MNFSDSSRSPLSQGCVKVGMSTLSRPAGRIEGCGVEPFTPFDTRSARGTLWVQDAHFCDFDEPYRPSWWWYSPCFPML